MKIEDLELLSEVMGKLGSIHDNCYMKEINRTKLEHAIDLIWKVYTDEGIIDISS